MYGRYYSQVETKIGKAFTAYGRFVARHPWKFVIIGILVNCMLGVGMVTLKVETDAVKAYTPINNQAKIDEDRLRCIFPDTSDSNFFPQHKIDPVAPQVWVLVYSTGGNILNQTLLRDIARLYRYVANISVTIDGEEIPFGDICVVQNGKCSVGGDVIFSEEFIAALTSGGVDFPIFFHSQRGPVYYEKFMASPVLTKTGTKLKSAQGVLLDFSLRTGSPRQLHLARQWEQAFLEKIQLFSANDLDISYSHSLSLAEELDKNVLGDVGLFALTIAIMVVYACLATFTARPDCVSQRMNLGFAGVLSAGLALVSAVGLVSLSGVLFVSTVGILPFLMIGIGVDDMFILLSGITHAPYNMSVEERIGEMMRTSGVAITITSLTDILAFAAGVMSTFIGVRNFCIYTAVAVLFCYINQATIFVGCIAINENRVASQRHALTCVTTRSKEECQKEGRSPTYVWACAGSPPTSDKEAESFLDRFPKWLFPKLVSPVPMKCLVLLIFSAYLGVSIWGITLMKEGLMLTYLVQDTSYAHKFYTHMDHDFQEQTLVSFVIDSPLKYSDPKLQKQISDLVDAAKADVYVEDDVEINWLHSYKLSPFYIGFNESSFITGLQNFLSQRIFTRFENDIVFDQSNSSIVASRFYVQSKPANSSKESGQLMLNMRDLASESSLPVFAYSSRFRFYEQYVVILGQTLQTMGLAVAMVFIVTVIFMPHPLLILYIVVTVSMITVGIFGFLHLLDLTLNSITMITIILSIGFSVDFTAHIAHGYMISKRETRAGKVEEAILKAGAPIFHGAASSVLGVVILSIANSYIFIAFFKMMSLVICFGIGHALLFLPVVLSLVGPMPKSEPKVKVKRHAEVYNVTETAELIEDRETVV